MKKLALSAALVSSLSFAQAPAPAPKAAPPPPPAPAAKAPAPAAPAAAAPAPAPAPAMEMDWSKMGPAARKSKNEAAVKKDVEAFLKAEDALVAKGDHEGMLARVAFPVWMVTDDMTGKPEVKAFTKDEYVATMKPFWDNMPKDTKYTHKPTITVLSDSIVQISDDYTMTMGKVKVAARSAGTLVKDGGSWKWSVMTEAGWGGMGAPPPAAAAPAPKAAPPAPAPAPTPAPAPKK